MSGRWPRARAEFHFHNTNLTSEPIKLECTGGRVALSWSALAPVTEQHRSGDSGHRGFLLTVLEAEKPKINILKYSVSNESTSSWSADCGLLFVALHGGSGRSTVLCICL